MSGLGLDLWDLLEKRRKWKCTALFLEKLSWEKRGCGTAGSSWSEGEDLRMGSKSCETKPKKGWHHGGKRERIPAPGIQQGLGEDHFPSTGS